MTVNKALEIINKIKAQVLEEYEATPSAYKKESSTDDDGNTVYTYVYIQHPLDSIDDDDVLFYMDLALKSAALKATPATLIETNSSTATELKRLSVDYFVRVPAEPVLGQELDIDDGLVYAVIFSTLGELWRDGSLYSQKADFIINTYNNAYRTYIQELLANGESTSTIQPFVRFSADGTNWHDSFTTGDLYISFRKVETDTWTVAIPFIGEDGQSCSDTNFTALQDTPTDYTANGGKVLAVKATEDGLEFIDAPAGGATTLKDLTDTPADYAGQSGKVLAVKPTEDGVEFIDAPTGSGASKFTDLTDTPDTLTADKWVKVNAAGDGLELTDAPSSGTGGGVDDTLDDTYWDNAGDITLTLYNQTDKSRFYIGLSGDTTVAFAANEDDYDGYAGRIYVFLILPNGYNFTWDANISWQGDATIPTNVPTLLQAFYDGSDWYVINKVTY